MYYHNQFISILLSIVFSVMTGCSYNPELVPSEGYVDITEGKIWYRILGEGDNIPLLLLHGGPGGNSCSFYQLSPLSDHRPIILFDQFGSGRSDHHTDTTLMKIEKFVEQVEIVKNYLGLNKFFLLGHSWGSAVALDYYLQHPKGIEGIIFSSPLLSTSIWSTDADTLISTLPDSIQRIIEICENNGDFDSPEYQQANKLFLKNFNLRTSMLPHKLDTVPAPGNYAIYNYMWGPSEFTATGTLKNYDRTESLSEIKIPTLFITGEFDEARPSSVQRLQSIVPNSKFIIIENAGHRTMYDNRTKYIEVIKSFLDEINLKN